MLLRRHWRVGSVDNSLLSASSSAIVARLMNGFLAPMLSTSPPEPRNTLFLTPLLAPQPSNQRHVACIGSTGTRQNAEHIDTTFHNESRLRSGPPEGALSSAARVGEGEPFGGARSGDLRTGELRER